MQIELTTTPQKADIEFIRQGLQSYGDSQIPGLPGIEQDLDFAIFSRDDESKLIGGLQASAYWNAMHIQLLWVSEQHRGQNIGSVLLQRAENHARENGFQIVYLDTVQARDFYIKHGYEVFGTIEEQPVGHSLYFMKKRLAGS